ncbi:hypothetical protein EZV62_023718 [Acer yangbiense]|uniref:DUF4283 domain-containing protein n=1 Tax=Acer yangbiense TaxID=1000413 RepID=A0A5C7H2F9_9ROSI|nr:hypothetical protein EZV62_023718 [Acer yangbiense]
MNPEDIASLYASLTITPRDGPIQLLDGHLMTDAKHRLSLCLVGKILSSKGVNRDAFMCVVGRIWQVKKGLDIESVSGNTFTFHLRDEYDLNRVIYGSPWSFDNALIALEKPVGMGTLDSLNFDTADFWVQIHQVPLLCMTHDIGRFLGGMIGEVLDVDGGNSGDCVGKFMRVRIRVDIKKSLKRCLRVDILGDGVETIMILRAFGSIRHSNFQSQRSSFFSPVNIVSNWRIDRGKEKLVPESVVGDGIIPSSSKQNEKADGMGRSGALEPDSGGSLQQEEMAVEWGCVEKRDVKSQTFISNPKVIIYHQLEEEVNNVDKDGIANAAINGEEKQECVSGMEDSYETEKAAINGEVLMGCAIEEEILGICGKTSGTLPII